SGVTEVVRDTAEEPRMVFPRLEGTPLRSLVAVPLVRESTEYQVPSTESETSEANSVTPSASLRATWYSVLGVLSAYSDRTDAFDGEAVRLLEAFGAVASTAMHN